MQREDPIDLNFELLEMQKWNISTDKAQRADEKNGIISLVIVFTPRTELWSLKYQNGLFFVFFADDSKKLVTDWPIYSSAPERSYLDWVSSFLNFYFNISRTVTPKSPFWRNSERSFRDA